jgi:hypothetical protein
MFKLPVGRVRKVGRRESVCRGAARAKYSRPKPIRADTSHKGNRSERRETRDKQRTSSSNLSFITPNAADSTTRDLVSRREA